MTKRKRSDSTVGAEAGAEEGYDPMNVDYSTPTHAPAPHHLPSEEEEGGEEGKERKRQFKEDVQLVDDVPRVRGLHREPPTVSIPEVHQGGRVEEEGDGEEEEEKEEDVSLETYHELRMARRYGDLDHSIDAVVPEPEEEETFLKERPCTDPLEHQLNEMLSGKVLLLHSVRHKLLEALNNFVAKVEARLETVKRVKVKSEEYKDLLYKVGYFMNVEMLTLQIRDLDDDVKRMEGMLERCKDLSAGQDQAKMEEFREALYQHKIDDMLVEWDYVYERYSRSAAFERKPSRFPSRAPYGEKKKTLKEHADFVFYETWAMGCGVAHWGIGERVTGPKYPRCRCFEKKEKK
jgi:hypothetical protein